MTAPQPANSRQIAARHLLRLRAAEENFADFIRLMHPEFALQPFHLDLASHLDRLGKRTLVHPTTGQLVTGLLVTMPPRHGKSQIATWLFPVWMLARDPRHYVMSCAYNAQLATDFGRKTLSYAQEPILSQAFPSFKLSTLSRAADHWQTTEGGAYVGVGIEGTTTGRAANLLIVDDPIKGRTEAESARQRQIVEDYYQSSLTYRLQPTHDGLPPIQLIIMTRWHPDDLAGARLKSDDWREGHWLHVSYRALNDHPDGPRALWPARFPVQSLQRLQRASPRDFAALYQQSPYIVGGNLFKSGWFRTYDPTTPTSYSSIVIALDSAFQTRTANDYSVFVVAGLTHDNAIHILDVVRRKLEYPDLRVMARSLFDLWSSRGLRALYVEDKASGQSLIQDFRREQGIAVIPVKQIHDKLSRATPILPMVEGGRVHLPHHAHWRDDFIEELSQFPNSRHDDQVDAFVMALDQLSRLSRLGQNPDDIFSRPSLRMLQSQILTPDPTRNPLSDMSRSLAGFRTNTRRQDRSLAHLLDAAPRPPPGR